MGRIPIFWVLFLGEKPAISRPLFLTKGDAAPFVRRKWQDLAQFSLKKSLPRKRECAPRTPSAPCAVSFFHHQFSCSLQSQLPLQSEASSSLAVPLFFSTMRSGTNTLLNRTTGRPSRHSLSFFSCNRNNVTEGVLIWFRVS